MVRQVSNVKKTRSILFSHAWKVCFDMCVSFSWVHTFLPDNLALSIPQSLQGTEMNGDIWIFGTPLFYAPWRWNQRCIPFFESLQIRIHDDPRFCNTLYIYAAWFGWWNSNFHCLKVFRSGKKKACQVVWIKIFHKKSSAQEYTAHYDRGTGNSEDITMGFTPRTQGDCGHCKGAADWRAVFFWGESTGITGKVSQNRQKGRSKDQLKMMGLNEYEWIWYEHVM